MCVESSGYKIKTLHPDCEAEFTLKEFAKFYEEKYCKVFDSPLFALTKRSCGEAKLNRNGDGKELLKGRNVPGEFWGEVIRHAFFLHTRLPSKSLPNITPCEA
nr:retrotransposon protein, putative, unclassified [Tanacetum cinerariifolium]